VTMASHGEAVAAQSKLDGYVSLLDLLCNINFVLSSGNLDFSLDNALNS
jgi:hypothetical protein